MHPKRKSKKLIIILFTSVLLFITACNKTTNEEAAKKQNTIFQPAKFSEEEKVEIKKKEAEEVINTYFNEIKSDGDACYPEKLVEAMSPIHDGDKFYKYISTNTYGDWFNVEMVMITSVSNGIEQIALSYIHLLPENMETVSIQPILCKDAMDEELLIIVNRYVLKIKAGDEMIDYEDLERKGFKFDKEENCWEKTEQLLFISEK